MKKRIKIFSSNKERLNEVNQGRILSLIYRDAIPRNLKKSVSGIWIQLLPKQLNFWIKTMVSR